MHRTTMLLLFAAPLFAGFANEIMVLITFPVLPVLEIDRELGARVFSAASGGSILSQHRFASRPAQLPRRTANPPRTGDTDA